MCSASGGILPSMDEMIVQKEAMLLPPRERAMLADALLVSLDDVATRKIEGAWIAEAEDRLSAFKKGDVSSEEGSQVLKSIRSKYGK